MPPKSRPVRSSRTSKSGPYQSGRENINITLNVDDTKGGPSPSNQGKSSTSLPQPPQPPSQPTQAPPQAPKLFQAPVDPSVNVNAEKLQTDQPISQGTLSLLTSTSSEVPASTTTTVTTGSSLPDLSLQNVWAKDKKKTTWIIVGCCLGAAVIIAIVVTVVVIKKKKKKKDQEKKNST